MSGVIDSPRHPSDASRRRGLDIPSARSLLLTVLSEFALPRGEPVWTQILIEVLARLGVEHRSARQAIARTAADGLISSHRVGRRTRWSLTERGQKLLTRTAQQTASLDAAPQPWDGRWFILLVRIPESRRQLRHQLRSRLASAGLGSPAPGVWIYPDPARQNEVAEIITDLDIAAATSSFVASFGSIGDQRGLVTQAWDLAEVERSYYEFLFAFGTAQPDGRPPDLLAHRILLAHAWRRSRLRDPKLPDELLPKSWVGRRAATLFNDLRQHWDPPAQQYWEQLTRRVNAVGPR